MINEVADDHPVVPFDASDETDRNVAKQLEAAIIATGPMVSKKTERLV